MGFQGTYNVGAFSEIPDACKRKPYEDQAAREYGAANSWMAGTGLVSSEKNPNAVVSEVKKQATPTCYIVRSTASAPCPTVSLSVKY